MAGATMTVLPPSIFLRLRALPGLAVFAYLEPVDSVKAEMFRDIGLADWLFEVEKTSGQQLWESLAKIHADPGCSRARVKTAMAGVAERQRSMVQAMLTAHS